MSAVGTLPEIDYPEADGKPMAETDIHIEWMIRIRAQLARRRRS